MDNQKYPHSLTLEQAVIAGAMAESEGWDAISDILNEKDFFSPRHAIIFSAIRALYSDGVAVDALIVSDWLKNNGLHQRAGGDESLAAILRDSPATSVNARVYAIRIREFSVLRQLLMVADEIKADVIEPQGKSTDDLIALAESRVLAISDAKEGLGKAIPVYGSVELIGGVFAEMESNMGRPEGQLSGIRTGFRSIDKLSDGFQPGDLIMIGARPSMGKTTLGMNFVEAALKFQDKPCVVFSMESPARQITQRLMASMADVPMDCIRRGVFVGNQYSRVFDVTGYLKTRNIHICDKGGLTPNAMRSVLRRIEREYGEIGIIMGDYVQKMKPNIEKAKGTRNDELTEISADIKEMAKDYNCPYVMLSQLSKACEQRPNKRPMNSDLRDCGGLEQDADMIIMLYRDEIYNAQTEHKGLAELIVTKNRNGPTGTVMTRFNGAHFNFKDVQSDDDEVPF